MKHYTLYTNQYGSYKKNNSISVLFSKGGMGVAGWRPSLSDFCCFSRRFIIYILITVMFIFVTTAIFKSFVYIVILASIFAVIKWGTRRIHQFWIIHHDRVNLLRQHDRRTQCLRNHLLLSKWRQEHLIKKTIFQPPIHIYEENEDVPESLKQIGVEVTYQHPKPPNLEKRVSHRISKKTATHATVFGVAILGLFLVQFITSIPTGETFKPISSNVPPEGHFLQLNHTTLMVDEDGVFEFNAFNQTLMICYVKDTTLVNFSIGDGETAPQSFFASEGLNWWAMQWGKEEGIFNVTFNQDDLLYIDSFAVQPVFLAEGKVNFEPEETQLTQIPFNGLGDIAILIWTFTKFDNLVVNLDGKPLKEVDIGFNVRTTAMVALQEGTAIRFNSWVPAGLHNLEIGGGNFSYCVVSQYDTDGDLIDDGTEMEHFYDKGTYPDFPDIWGTQYDMAENVSGVFDKNSLPYESEEYWTRHSIEFYIPGSYIESPNFLFIEAYNGIFKQFEIDKDGGIAVGDIILNGSSTACSDIITREDIYGHEYTGEAWQFAQQNSYCAGVLEPGWHEINYLSLAQMFETEDIRFRINNNYIRIWDWQTLDCPETDSDGDSVPDNVDLSPSNYINWRFPEIHQLVLPVDESGSEDVEINFQVLIPEDEKNIKQPVIWHKGAEGEIKCRIVPAMRLFGSGDVSDSDYWYKTESFVDYWGENGVPRTIVTNNLVAFDSWGNVFNPTMDLELIPGNDPYAYYTFINPEIAGKVYQYTVNFAHDFPAIVDDAALSIFYDFCYLVVDENWDNATTSVLHVYDYEPTQPLRISGVQIKTYSDINALAAAPNSQIEDRALRMLNQNPAMDDGVHFEWDQELKDAVLTQVTDGHLLQSWQYNPRDPTTWSVAERLERESTTKTVSRYTENLDFSSGFLTTEEGWGSSPNFWWEAGAPYIGDYYGMPNVLRMDIQPNKAVGAWYSFNESFFESTTGSVSFDMIWSMDQYSFNDGQIWFGLGRQGQDIASIRIYQGAIWYGDQLIHSITPRIWFRVDFKYDLAQRKVDLYINGVPQKTDLPFLIDGVPDELLVHGVGAGPLNFYPIPTVTGCIDNVLFSWDASTYSPTWEGKNYVEYVTMTQKVMDPLSKILLGVRYDQETHEEFIDYCGSWDFSDSLAASGWITESSSYGTATILPHFGSHANVATVDCSSESNWFGISHSIASPQKDGEIGLYFALDPETQPALKISLKRNGISAIDLVIQDGELNYVDPVKGNKYLSDVWYGAFFSLNIIFHSQIGKFDVLLSTPGYCINKSLPYMTQQSFIDSIEFQSFGGKAYLDAIWCNWTGNFEGHYVPYSFIKAGDSRSRICIETIRNVYNGTVEIDSDALKTDNTMIWESSWSDEICEHEEIMINYLPIKVSLNRAGIAGYETHDRLEVTYAGGLVSPSDLSSITSNMPDNAYLTKELTLETINEWTGEGYNGLPPTINFNDVNGDIRKINIDQSFITAARFTRDLLPNLYDVPIISSGVASGLLRVSFYIPSGTILSSNALKINRVPRDAGDIPLPINEVNSVILKLNVQKLVDNFADFASSYKITQTLIEKVRVWEASNLPAGFETTLYKNGLGEYFTDIRANSRVLIQLGILDSAGKSWIPETVTRLMMDENRDQILRALINYQRYCNFLSPEWLQGVDDPYVYLCKSAVPRIDPFTQSVLEFQGKVIVDVKGNFHVLSGTWSQMESLLRSASQESLDDLFLTGGFIIHDPWDIAATRTFMVNILSDVRDPGTLNALFRSIQAHKAEPFSWSSIRRMGGKPTPWKFRDPGTGKFTSQSTVMTKSAYWKIVSNSPDVGDSLPGLGGPLLNKDTIQEIPDLSGKYLDDLGLYTSQIVYGASNRIQRALLELKLEIARLEDQMKAGTWIRPDGTIGTPDDLKVLRGYARVWEDQLQYRQLPLTSDVEIWDDSLKHMVTISRKELYSQVIGDLRLGDLKGYGFPGTLFSNPNPGKLTSHQFQLYPANWWPDNDIFLENRKTLTIIGTQTKINLPGAPRFWSEVYMPYYLAPQFQNTYHKGIQGLDRYNEVQKFKTANGKTPTGIYTLYEKLARREIVEDSQDAFRMVVILAGVVGNKELTEKEALFVYWELRSILELYEGSNIIVEDNKRFPGLAAHYFPGRTDYYKKIGLPADQRFRTAVTELMNHPDLQPFTQEGAIRWNELKNIIFGQADDATLEKWFGRLGYHSGYPGGADKFFVDHRTDLPWIFKSQTIADSEVAAMEEYLRPTMEIIDLTKCDFYQKWLDWIAKEWKDQFYPVDATGKLLSPYQGKRMSMYLANSLNGQGIRGDTLVYGQSHIHEFFAERLGLDVPTKQTVNRYAKTMKEFRTRLQVANGAGRDMAGFDYEYITDTKLIKEWQSFCIKQYDEIHIKVWRIKKGVEGKSSLIDEFFDDPFGTYIDPDLLHELSAIAKQYDMDVINLIAEVRHLDTARKGVIEALTSASMWDPSIWDVVGNILGIFLDMLFDREEMEAQVKVLEEQHGMTNLEAWDYVNTIYDDKWIWEAAISSVVDLTVGGYLSKLAYNYVINYMLTNLWSETTSKLAAWGARLAVALVIAWIVTQVVRLVWDYNTNEQLRYEFDWTTDMNIKFQPEISFTAATTKAISKHLSLTVGDSLEIKTTIENQGQLFWDWDPPSLFNGFVGAYRNKRDDVNSPTSGAPFWFCTQYAFDDPDAYIPDDEWTDWVGQWNTGTGSDITPPMVGYHYGVDPDGTTHQIPFEWDIYTRETGNALWHTPARTYTSTFSFIHAMPSVSMYIQQRVASTFQHWTDHGKDVSVTPIEGMRVLEGTLSEFMARCTPEQTEEDITFKVSQLQDQLEGYNWSQAKDLGEDILTELQIMTLGYSEEEFMDLKEQVKDLSDSDAPAQYRRASDSRLIEFSEDEKDQYGAITFNSRADFNKFFDHSYKGASTFIDLGFQVPGPEWSNMATTTIKQDFNDQGYQEFPTDWFGTLGSAAQIYTGDEIGAPATYYSYAGSGDGSDSWCAGTTGYKYVAVNCLNANGAWIGKKIGMAPKGTVEISMIGPCPPGYSSPSIGYTMGLGYWDGATLTDVATYRIVDTDKDGMGVVQYGGRSSFETIDMTKWKDYRISWNYADNGFPSVNIAYQYYNTYEGCLEWRYPFSISGYIDNKFTGNLVPNVFFIREDTTGGMGWFCFDDVRIYTYGTYYGSNAFAYSFYPLTSPQLLVPKIWLERMTRCYNLMDNVQFILNHIPIEAELEVIPDWGEILEILPGETAVVSLVVDVKAAWNVDADIEWEIVNPDGFDIYPKTGYSSLQEFSDVTFSIKAQDTTAVGLYPFTFHVHLTDEDHTEIFAKDLFLRYVNVRDLAMGYIPVEDSPYIWGEEVGCATLTNNGNSPEWVNLEIEGLPKEWFYSRGYYSTETELIKYYDFTSSTQGFSSGTATSSGLLLQPDSVGSITSATSGIFDLHTGDQLRILYQWTGTPVAQFRLMRSEAPVHCLSLEIDASSNIRWKEYTYKLQADEVFDGLEFKVEGDVDDKLYIFWICIENPLVLPETSALYDASLVNDEKHGWNIIRSPDPVTKPWSQRFSIDWTLAISDAIANEYNIRGNFGTDLQLEVTPAGSGTQKIAFIQRPEIPYFTNGAHLKLKLWNTAGIQCRILIYETIPFDESELTWARQPLLSHLVANITIDSGENIIQLDSTANAFAIVVAPGSAGACFFSKESGDYGPQFAWDIPNRWQGDGILYMQSEELATYSLYSPLLSSTQLTTDDWVYVRFADSTSSEVSLSLLYGGLVNAEFIIAPAGETLEKLHWRHFVVPHGLQVDQIRITSSLSGGEFVFIDELSLERPQVYSFIQANLGGFFNETVPLDILNCYSPLASFAADGWVLDDAIVPNFTQQMYLTESDVVDSMSPSATPDWLREYFFAFWHSWPEPYSFFERRTYFEIPQAPTNFADPVTSLYVYFTYAGTSAMEEVYDHCLLNVAPALGSFEEGQLCWNNQPGYDETNIIWQLSADEIATTFVTDGYIVPITGLTPGNTYCMFVKSPIATENLQVIGYGDEGLYGDPRPYVTYTWDKVTSTNGSLVLQTDVEEELTVNRLTDITLPTGGQARVQFHGSLVNGASIKFYLEGGDTLIWDLSSNLVSYPISCLFSLPVGCHIHGIEVSGDLAAEGQFILDYLVFEEQSRPQSLEEVEWGGYRDVLKVPAYGRAEYFFESSRASDYVEFWFGGYGNCTINLGNQLMPLSGITFGLTNNRWWFVNGSEVKYTSRIHKDSWEHIRVMWNCDSGSDDTFTLVFNNETFGALTGCLITGSPLFNVVDYIHLTAGSGEGWRLDALCCGWQNVYGLIEQLEGTTSLSYTIGANFGENVLKNATGQLAFLMPGHWREYYFSATESYYPSAGTHTCFVKSTDIYTHWCVGKCNFSVLVPHIYSTSFSSLDGDTHLSSQEVDSVFKYNFFLQNSGNAPQNYTIATEGLMPHATPVFSALGLVEGSESFEVTLIPNESISFSLTLINAEPCLCYFSIIASSLTLESPIVIPASFLINMPPSVTSQLDLTYEQASTGNKLIWTMSDASPVPGRNNYYGIYTNSTTVTPAQFQKQYWATYTFDGISEVLPGGWFADLVADIPARHAIATGASAGSLWIPGWFEDDYYCAWCPIGDRTTGTVEWWNYPGYGIMEAGLFRDGEPIATVIGGNLDGWGIDTSVNGISMEDYYDYISMTFDAAAKTFNITAKYVNEPYVLSWSRSNLVFANDLVPNEFRVRIIGHMTWQGVEQAGEGRIDNLGFSWDPQYRVGDNVRVRLVQAGQFNPAGEVLEYNIDGLVCDPVTGFADYKFVMQATDRWVDTTTGTAQPLVVDLVNVRVLSPEPVILSVSGDITYEYGTSGHVLEWQMLDAATSTPTYELWRAGAGLAGHFQGSESFRNVQAGTIPTGWSRDDPARVGVIDEVAGHYKCLNLVSDNYMTHSATMTFPVQSGGTVEWYTYWDSAGSLDVNFGDVDGRQATITAETWNGRLYIYTPTGNWAGGNWYPTPTMPLWHRFRFDFNAFTGDFSFTSYSQGCLGWQWNGQPYGVGNSFTWTGNFGPQSPGVSYVQFEVNPDAYGRSSYWDVDAIGFSWDPFYEVGDLVNLEREMKLVSSGTWTSGDLIQVSVDGLEVGTHDFTFAAFDGNGYASSKHGSVVVFNVAPEVVVEPTDLTFLAGTLVPSIEWTPSDASTLGASYHISIEGFSEVASGTWVSGTPIAWNPSELPVGEHHVLLELDDGLGGVLYDEVILKANDRVAFMEIPIDFSYYVGEPDFTVQWTVADNLGMNPSYDVFVRGFEGETGIGDPLVMDAAWTTGAATVIPVNFGGMPAGLYIASLVVSDGLGAEATDRVVFCVTPEGMDALDWLESELIPAGYDMACGTSSSGITVDVTFDTSEDTEMAIGIWTTPPQPEGPDFTTEGVYFTVDAERETAVTFPIYVDVTLPSGFPAGMTESDVASWLRLLYFDEVSEMWVDPHFPIVAIDLAAGTATFEVWHLSTFALGFAKGLPPKIDGPGSLAYEYCGSSPHLISWRLADLTVGPNPTYAIFRDGFLLGQGSWSFGMEVTVDASRLMVGTYNYEVFAFDDLGGAASCNVPVTVYNVAPVLSNPADLVYEAGSAGNMIAWMPEDISAINPTYIITIDAIQAEAGTWTSGSPILYFVGGMMPGVHAVECTVEDGIGMSCTDQVLVTVTNTKPAITAPPTMTYEDGDPRPLARWIIVDSSVLTGTYDLFLDGTFITTGTWASGIPLDQNVGGLALGTHTYQMVARDGYGAVNNACATVIVLPDDDTTVSIAKLNATATGFNVTVVFDDIDPSGIASVDWVKVNGTSIANYSVTLIGSQWVVTFDHAFSQDGIYLVEFQIRDADADRPDDQASSVFIVNVNVTGCDPVKTLMEGVLTQINLLEADIDQVDSWIWRELLSFFAGRAECSMMKALDLYLAGNVPAATVRVWVAQCAVHVDGILVRVGEMIGMINPDLASALDEHITIIQTNLQMILRLLTEVE